MRTVRQEAPPAPQLTQKAWLPPAIIVLVSILLFIIDIHYEVFAELVEFVEKYKHWHIDELIPVAVFLTFALGILSFHEWRKIRLAEKRLLDLNDELRKALAEIKQLQDIIPICASCKKIRDDEGFWHQVEVYVSTHTGSKFTHGICPQCIETLYPELVKAKADAEAAAQAMPKASADESERESPSDN